jgi:hypothetical protein
MMGDLIEVAKEKRAEDGYKKGDERFVPVALLFVPDLDPAVIPLTWDTNDQKRNLMRALSLTARQVGAEAIALITDTRWTNSERISEYYNLPTVAQVGIEEFGRLYNKLRNERYDGEIKNMPREVWEEAVTVMMKGPGLTPQVRMAHYKEAANDGIEWLEEKTTNADNRAEFMLLPDWWTH